MREPSQIINDDRKACNARHAALAGILAIHFALVLISSPRLSPCYDEPIHIAAGMALLTRGTHIDTTAAWWTAVDPLTPPMDMLPAALARLAGKSPDYRADPFTPFTQVRAARWANHLVGAAMLVILYLWGGALWGAGGGVFAALLLLVHPLFVAHSTIVSSDLFGAFGGLLAAWVCWTRFIGGGMAEDRTDLSDPSDLSNTPNPVGEGLSSDAPQAPASIPAIDRRLLHDSLVMGAALGVATACKVSNLIFIAAVPAAIILKALHESFLREPDDGISPGPRQARFDGAFGLRLRRATIAAGISAAMGLALAAAIYGFAGLDRPAIEIGGRTFRLPFGHTLAHAAWTTRFLPAAHPVVWFMGRIEPPSARHFAAAFLFRTPLPLLFLFALIPLGLRLRFRFEPRLLRRAVWPIALAAGLTLLFVTRGFYIGLRHLLLPISLLALLGGALPGAAARLRRTEAAREDSPRRHGEHGEEGSEEKITDQREKGRSIFPCSFFSSLCSPCLRGENRVESKDRPGPFDLAVVASLALAAVMTARATPWQISYMGRFAEAGGARPAPFVDADFDWGGGLLALRDWQRAGAGRAPVFLAYFGNARPEDYGVSYRGLLSPFAWAYPDAELGGERDPARLRGWVVISATQLAGTYMSAKGQPPDYYAAWRDRTPDATLAGGSLLLFDNRDSRPGPPVRRPP